MDAVIQVVRRFGLIQRVIPVITAIALVFSLAAGFLPEPYDRDDVQNVIFLIGDGMGENHLKWQTGTWHRARDGNDAFEGPGKNSSIGMVVTDSAAAGTALACGVRTTNGAIGVYPYDMFAWESYPVNLTELAIEKGMKTGIVTTDSTTGATPAAFSAHTSARGNSADIANQQIGSDIDLIWGAANGDTQKTNVEASGFTYVTTFTQMNALNAGTRSFGQFNGGDLWRAGKLQQHPDTFAND
jgi:alkaline phosphatase